MTEKYKPHGHVIVLIKERLHAFAFDSREEWVDLSKWLQTFPSSQQDLIPRIASELTIQATIEEIYNVADTPAKEQIKILDIYKTQDPPICKTHKTPMVPSKKDPGGFYCSRKANGEYCQNYVSSDGKYKNE